jgi:hypothetical protein
MTAATVTLFPVPDPAPAPALVVTLSPVQAEVLRAALADAAEYRRDRAGAYCLDCACERCGLCPGHAREFDIADDYDDLAETLNLPAGSAR